MLPVVSTSSLDDTEDREDSLEKLRKVCNESNELPVVSMVFNDPVVPVDPVVYKLVVPTHWYDINQIK
jgi:hypothetical protein